MKVAIAGIVKNEFPYLLEWIAYHKEIGIDHFIIANHGSTDGTTELLEALQKLGLVTTFFIPNENEAPQLPAYEKIANNYKKDFDWIGFLDADEFVLIDKETSLKQILEEQKKDVGAVVLNWAVYGSSFQSYPLTFDLSIPVTSRFLCRAKQDTPINSYGKSFIKTKAFLSVTKFINPNTSLVKDGFNYVNILGEQLDFLEEGTTFTLPKVHWQKARLNHYTIKSKWEFIYKKRPKGLADKIQEYRGYNFFHSHDKNDVFEEFPLHLAKHRNRGLQNMKEKLLSIGYKIPNTKIIPSLPEKFYEIEKVEQLDGNVIITGWSMDQEGNPNIYDYHMTLRQEGTVTSVRYIEPTVRKDIKTKYFFASALVGFKIHFEKLVGTGSVQLYEGDNYLGELFPLNTN